MLCNTLKNEFLTGLKIIFFFIHLVIRIIQKLIELSIFVILTILFFLKMDNFLCSIHKNEHVLL